MKKRFFRVSAWLLAILVSISVLWDVLPASAANLLYEDTQVYEGMNPGEGEEAIPLATDKAYGPDYVLETVINVHGIGEGDGRGVKFILRACSAATSGDMEVWIGPKNIWACTNEWKGHTSFDFSPYMNQDTAVKLAVKGDTVTMYLNNVEVWSCTDATISASTASVIKMGGWDARYTIKGLKITESETSANPGGVPGGEVTDGVLYQTDFDGTPYEGMNPADGQEAVDFRTDKAYGKEFVLEAVIHVNSIGEGDGRGVKFVLGASKVSTSGDLELWIGKSAIWACTNEWKGHTAFDFSSYMGKDTTVKIVAKGSKLALSLNGTEVWSAEDTTFGSATESPVRLSGWDTKYLIKEVKLTSVTDEGSTPTQPEDPNLKEEDIDPTPAMGGTIYYVDTAAPDGGDGKSPETAFKSIEQVNAHEPFLPDDQILFKRGCVWEGVTLQPKGYGIENHPIVVDSYGEGDLPVIDRRGKWVPGGENGSSAILLENQSYWTFRNIQISNQNPVKPGTVEDVAVLDDHAEFPMRNGLTVRAVYVPGAAKKVVRGIVVENVVFDGIDGTTGDEGNCYKNRVDSSKDGWAGGGALCIRAQDMASGTSRAYVDGIRVENCTFHNIGGIGVTAESGWTYYDSFDNLVVRNSRFYNDDDYDASSHGMYIVSTQSPLVEYNSLEGLSNGIAFQVCDNAVAQYNTIVDMDGLLHTMSRFMGEEQHWDGVGIDADCRCRGTTTFRCNYVEECYAGSFGFFDYQDTEPAAIVLDNNISYNCAKFLYYQCDTQSYTFTITNNTVVRTADSVYADNKKVMDIYNSAPPKGALVLEKNIFYYPGHTARLNKVSSIFRGNAYFGDISLPTDSSAITEDPLLILPPDRNATRGLSYDGGVSGTSSFCDTGWFTCQEGSPCLTDDGTVYGVDFSVFKEGVRGTGDETQTPSQPTEGDPVPPGTGLSVGVWIGIVVGIVLILAAGGAVILVLCRKKKAAAGDTSSREIQGDTDSGDEG